MRAARVKAWIDCTVLGLASLPMLAVLAGSGEAFLVASFFAPVGIVVACVGEERLLDG